MDGVQPGRSRAPGGGLSWRTSATSWIVPAVLTALVATAPTGCSWAVVQEAPRPSPRGERVPCTESVLAPIVDTVVAAVAMTVAIVLGAASSRTGGSSPAGGPAVPELAVAIGSGAAVLPFAASAVRGFIETRRCRQLHDEVRRRPSSH